MKEQIDVVLNSGQAFTQLRELLVTLGPGMEGAAAQGAAALEFLEKRAVSASTRQEKAVLRHVEAIQKQTEAYLKSPIEKLNAARDREIANLQKSTLALEQQAAAIQTVNASYDSMIAAETAASAAAGASTRQVTALEKAMETGSINNNRAAASFLINVLKLGPALSTAFQVFSAVAFLGVIYEMGQALYKVYKDAQEAPRKIQTAYEELYSSAVKTNDAEELTNVKLANQIAKLEHKPQNLVKQALLEARQAADELAEALTKDNEKLIEFLKNNEHGFWGSFAGTAPTTDLTTVAKKYQNQLVDIRYKGTTGEYTPEQVTDAEKKAQAAFRKTLQGEIAATEADIKRSNWNRTGAKTEDSTFYAKYQYEKYMLSMLGPEENKVKNAITAGSLKGELPKAEAAAKYGETAEKLEQELAKTQQGETSELGRINVAHEERIRHLIEEGQLTAQQVKDHTGLMEILDKIKAAEYERYNRGTARQLSTTIFTGEQQLARSRMTSGYELAKAQQRWNGEDTSESTINAGYQNATGINENMHAEANRRVYMLLLEGNVRDALDTREKERVRYKEAADEAELRRTIELGDLKKKLADEASKNARADFENSRKIEDAFGAVQERAAQASIHFRSRMRLAMHATMVGGEKQLIQENEADAIDAARQQYSSTSDRISKQSAAAESLPGNTDEEKRARAKSITDLQAEGIKANGELEAQIDEAHRQRTLQTLELWNRQFEEIKGKTENLVHTLFTNPKGFTAQLGTTVRDAALHPIEQRISTVVAERLNTLFHGPKPETKMTDPSHWEGDALKVWVTNTTAGGSSGRPGASSPSMLQQLMSLPTRMNPLAGMMLGMPALAAAGAAGVPGGMVSSSIDFGNGPEGFGSAIYGGTAGASGSSGGVGSIVGGGPGGGGLAGTIQNLPGYNKTNTSNILGNLKGIKLGGLTRNADGKITGVNGLAGAGLMMGGSFLAQRGLMGNDRGTTAGMFEGAAGGAMIGLQAGGPIGAVIGGAVGFGIGLGEKIAGVESPQREAKRLVKQMYHIDISSSMADQIVNIAAQKYGKHVSIAVRDPEVRKMLELYAAGTGQNMPQSATTPHGGSLAESGGRLYQEQTYKYGAGYAFQSNLPVAGGFSPTMYPNPGGPMNLSISVNGKGAGDFLAGNVVTSDYVQAQWSGAMRNSNGRVNSSAMLQQPGLVIA